MLKIKKKINKKKKDSYINNYFVLNPTKPSAGPVKLYLHLRNNVKIVQTNSYTQTRTSYYIIYKQIMITSRFQGEYSNL